MTQKRPIRSFVRREGRITPAQRRAIKDLWPQYGISPAQSAVTSQHLFGRDTPFIVEIGFGMGHALLDSAIAHPNVSFLGIEVYRPGVGALLLNIEKHQLNNIKLISDDAIDVLENTLSNSSIDCLQLFFPDPWPKKRHHKRRIAQPSFVSLVRDKLKPGGILHMVTDWEDYAEHMQALMSSETGWEVGSPDDLLIPRPKTKYEQRGERLGHAIWEGIYKKIECAKRL